MALSIAYWAKYVEGHTKLLRKSETSVECGRVLKFTMDEQRVVCASVQASMKDKSYSVQIFLEEEDNGMVKTTRCECPMAEYKCHHVAAALLFGYKRASKTDVKCRWIKHPKSVPKLTMTMSDLYPTKQKEYRALKRSVTAEDRQYLYNQLGQLGRFTALHWMLAEEPKPVTLPVHLMEDLLVSDGYIKAEDKETWLRQELCVSEDKRVQTAFLTAGQRENSLWAAVRKLRFTASNFGQIISAARRNRLTPSLKKRLLSAYNLEKRAPIQWGISQEATAIQKYCEVGGVTIVQTGIWLHESGILGASPDGFVQGIFGEFSINKQEIHQKDIMPDIVEIKCPFSAKDTTVMEAIKTNRDFFLELSPDGRITLKQTHDYWHQIQGQLHLTGTQCCDLAIWTTRDIQIVRIVKDNSWPINISVMIEFYMTKFLPSL